MLHRNALIPLTAALIIVTAAPQAAAAGPVELCGKRLKADVTEVDLQNCGTLNDEQLKQLTGLKQLKDLNLHGTGVTDEGLKLLKGLTTLERLALGGTMVTDEGLKQLKGLRALESLELRNTFVTDEGLRPLKELQALRELDLYDTKVRDEGLKHLKRLKALKELALESTAVTNRGLKHLKGLKALEKLILSHTNVTNAGLKHLKGLKALKELDLLGTRVTAKGLKQLSGLKARGTRILITTRAIMGAGTGANRPGVGVGPFNFKRKLIIGHRVEALDGPGQIKKDVIRRHMRRRQGALKHCYNKALRTKPDLKGTLRIRFLINTLGRVGTVTIRSKAVGTSVATCVVSKLKHWRFARPTGGTVSVDYMWNLDSKPSPRKPQRFRRPQRLSPGELPLGVPKK